MEKTIKLAHMDVNIAEYQIISIINDLWLESIWLNC